MRYFRIKNFDRFQHYKSSTSVPTWIKLYAAILIDPEFLKLPDVSKGHLMLIWIIASQLKNRVLFDSKYVAQIIGANGKVDLQGLVDAGFLEIDESALERSESDSETTLERSGETTSTLILSSSLSSEGESGKPNPEPLTPQDLVDGWNEVCPPLGLPKVEMLSATRRQKALARLREHPQDDFWNKVMARMRGSPFLLGRSNGNSLDHKGWKANFDWLIENDTNAVKVYEGRYAKEA